MTATPDHTIRLAAVGDLLLTALPGEVSARGVEALGDDIRKLFSSCDIVFANLECTLPGEDCVMTEPLVLSTERQIRSLRDSGINIVTLGNNHSFDCFDQGYQKLTDILAELEITYFGAGSDYDEAVHPVVVERNGVSVAFLGFVDASSGPHDFAGEAKSGVAEFNVSHICQQIREIKAKVDHVVISPHWGLERFRIPSVDQVEQAHALVDAGASMLLGHHPHVMQGLEMYRNAPVAYSLGNFLANNVYWRNGDQLTWNRFERTGMLLIAELSAEKVISIEQLPVFDDGRTISLDGTGRGDQYIERANRLLRKGITEKGYRREKFHVQTVKPLLAQLSWSKIKRIRPGHFRKLLRLLSPQQG
jgi:poly-gamma-glutamate synthesis protein (capsule biosynthesis protein)